MDPHRQDTYLRHVYGADGQRLEAEECPLFVLFPSLQHHMELIALTFQKVRILQATHQRHREEKMNKKSVSTVVALKQLESPYA